MSSLQTIYHLLRTHFGPLHGPDARSPWWPIFSSGPLSEIVDGAVLVQQTRWETVEGAILRLREADLLHAHALAAADAAQVAALIRPAAFHTQKAPGLIAIAQYLCTHYEGSVARFLARPTAELRVELLAMPRIGRETCDVIMLYAGAHPLFVIDEYTRRLFERVAPTLSTAADPATLWRAPYDTLRTAVEAELTPPAASTSHAALYADYHAQINEVCVRYCLSKPRCDGPPARRIYSRQPERESYLEREDGCPLRVVCAWYQSNRKDG